MTARFQEWAEGELKLLSCGCSRSYIPASAKLKSSTKLSTTENLRALRDNFDTGIKRTYSGISAPQLLVNFGSPRVNNPNRDVKNGNLGINQLVVSFSRTGSPLRSFPSETKWNAFSNIPSIPLSGEPRPS